MAQKYHWQSLSALDAPSEDPVFDTNSAKVVRLIEPAGNVGGALSSAPRSSPQDWSKLVDLVRDAGNYARETEARAQEQEFRVRQLLDQTREDIRNAAERVRAAEARTAEIQTQADALRKAAEQKVKVAEERAQAAEEWLVRIYDTIASEFAVEPASKQIA